MDKLWLPTGHHWDLHVEHHQLEDAGAFTGGGWKLVLHTTESDWDQVDLMYQVLKGKRAAPHFIIGGRAGLKHPVVIQCAPLNRAARALANDSSDGCQTNRANAVQVEVCGRTSEIPDWPEWQYQALANLAVLVGHRVPVPNVAPQDFSDPRRMGDREWVDARGYVDHRMCPDNDHVDGFRFREGYFIGLVDGVPPGGYAL